MADKVVFDPQKLQSGSLVDCQEQQLLELAKKLCRIAAVSYTHLTLPTIIAV